VTLRLGLVNLLDGADVFGVLERHPKPVQARETAKSLVDYL